MLSVMAPVESMQYEAGVRPPYTRFCPSLSCPTEPSAPPAPAALRPKQQVPSRATKAFVLAVKAKVVRRKVFMMITCCRAIIMAGKQYCFPVRFDAEV